MYYLGNVPTSLSPRHQWFQHAHCQKCVMSKKKKKNLTSGGKGLKEMRTSSVIAGCLGIGCRNSQTVPVTSASVSNSWRCWRGPPNTPADLSDQASGLKVFKILTNRWRHGGRNQKAKVRGHRTGSHPATLLIGFAMTQAGLWQGTEGLRSYSHCSL